MNSYASKRDLPLQIFMSEEVFNKQRTIIDLVPGEVAWFGLVKPVERPSGLWLEVYDLLIPEQEVSHGHVSWKGAMNPLLDELIAAERGDEIQNLRFFAHSHGDMDAYHSATDLQQIIDLGKADFDWFISHVENKFGKSDTRFDQFSPFRLHVEGLQIRDAAQFRRDGEIAKEIQEKVKQFTILTSGDWTTPWMGGLRKPTLTRELAHYFFGDDDVMVFREHHIMVVQVGGERLIVEDLRTGDLTWNDQNEDAAIAEAIFDDNLGTFPKPWEASSSHPLSDLEAQNLSVVEVDVSE